MNLLKSILDWLKGVYIWFSQGDSAEPADTDPIRHVILLMFENHSFDQMLGCFQSIFPNEVDGVDPSRPRSNKDSTGREYLQEQSSDPTVSPDPKHEVEHILNAVKGGNSGFVSEYE